MSYITVVCRLTVSCNVEEASKGIVQLRADLDQVTTLINDGHYVACQQPFVPLPSYTIPVRIIVRHLQYK